MTGSTGFAVIRPTNQRYREAVYLAATNPENIDRLAHLADGAAYPAVRPDVVFATPVSLPSDDILQAFSRLTGSLVDRVAAAERESRTFAELRDTLLPKLISGELRVPDAERFLEAAR